MKWSSFLHVITVLVGIVGIVAVITGWILQDKILMMGWTGNDLADKSMMLMSIAIWTALGTLIHLSKEDNKED